MYVYEIRPDWYDEFLSIGDEIAVHLPTGSDGAGRRRFVRLFFE